MGRDQNANFGVRSDFFDRLFRTRKFYKGTHREERDWLKRSLTVIKNEERKRG
jgi:sterol desaturase/sphingolipid hydroxylase (fatty acid hydroxylase superfamily)